MLSFSVAVFSLLTLVQVRPSASQFVFEFGLHSVSTDGNCGLVSCDTYLPIFCLREERDTQSTNTEDCPLGSSGQRIDADELPLTTLMILSPKPWPVSRREVAIHIVVYRMCTDQS